MGVSKMKFETQDLTQLELEELVKILRGGYRDEALPIELEAARRLDALNELLRPGNEDLVAGCAKAAYEEAARIRSSNAKWEEAGTSLQFAWLSGMQAALAYFASSLEQQEGGGVDDGVSRQSVTRGGGQNPTA
jgi:hypothetical protein